MNKKDIMIYTAYELANGDSRKDICTSWGIYPETLNAWENDLYFQSCIEFAKNFKKQYDTSSLFEGMN